VNESHTHYTIELRNDDGSFIVQQDLLPRAFHHASKDLAILHLEKELSDDPNITDEELGPLRPLNLVPLRLPEEKEEMELFQPGKKLLFYGHDVRRSPYSKGQSEEVEEEDTRMPVPLVIPGTIAGRTANQVSDTFRYCFIVFSCFPYAFSS